VNAAAVELLASREDTWSFLAEPYHLADWWPGIVGVEPDRRGFAEGARWTVRVVDSPSPFGLFRVPRMGRPSGRAAEQTLVITGIDMFELWAWDLVTRTRRRGTRTLSTEVRLSYVDRSTTKVTVSVSGWGATPGLAGSAVKRLYDLVQTAATL
jgi:hypothetical protein